MSTDVILVSGDHPAPIRLRMQEAAPDHDIVFLADLPGGIRDVDRSTRLRVVGSGGSLPADDFDDLPHLRWVHTWAAGPDSDLYPAMLASPVVLTSAVGNGAVPLAEHAMMLMLMLNRDAPRWARAQNDRRWDRFTHGELSGLTLGIYGLGNSGADLVQKARAFHMSVVGLRRRSTIAVEGVDEMFGEGEFHEFLARSDIVVVTAPITDLTRGVFDDAAFAAMKPSAFFICISRGGIADDDALLRALDSGAIAGAGLDAHDIEPLPADSPFWTLPNVIVTPHNGATTLGTARRGTEIFIDDLRRFARGDDLRNVVDKEAGY